MVNSYPNTLEIWKPVHGWETSHEVSNLGNVKTVERWMTDANGIVRHYKSRHLRQTVNKGYAKVRLCCDTRKDTGKVHILVLEAFVGPRPAGMFGLHSNGIPLDNTLQNLRWGTPKDNAADRVLHGTDPKGWRNPRAKLTHEQILRIREEKKGNLNALCKALGVSSGTLWAVRSGKNWGWLHG